MSKSLPACRTHGDPQRDGGRTSTNLPETASEPHKSALRHLLEEIFDWLQRNPECTPHQNSEDNQF